MGTDRLVALLRKLAQVNEVRDRIIQEIEDERKQPERSVKQLERPSN